MRTRLVSLFAAPAPGRWPGAGPLVALLTGLLLSLAAAPAALAHGTEMSSGLGQGLAWIKAGYAGGEAMEFAKVRVVDPQGHTHQVGNADGQGRFAWFVDQEGEWTAIAEDGMGHRGEISLRAGTAASNAPEPVREASGSPPQWTKAILGLSAIFWLSGLVFWRNGRKGHARREPR